MDLYGVKPFNSIDLYKRLHLLSERLQKLKPEVTPTYALICKRRHIGWSQHEE